MPSRCLALHAAALPAALSFLLTGCSTQSFVGVVAGPLDDAHNRTLRREVLSLAAPNLCQELMKRSLPLRLQPDDPALGRFFPAQCTVKSLPNGDYFITLGGTGYAWSNITKRVGFTVNATIQYDWDFHLDGSTAYVYFRPAQIAARTFEMLVVEEEAMPATPLAQLLPGSTPAAFVRAVGAGLLEFELREGFTVVRDAHGDVSFAIGSLEPGEKPVEPYEHTDHGRVQYANERVELHRGQRDYLGPIEVGSSGMAIFLTASLEGAAQIDLQVLPRATCEPWLQRYVAAKEAPPSPGGAITEDVVERTQPGAQPFRKAVPVPKGSYFVVLDNTANAGQTAPSSAGSDDRVALVGIGIEVGSAP